MKSLVRSSFEALWGLSQECKANDWILLYNRNYSSTLSLLISVAISCIISYICLIKALCGKESSFQRNLDWGRWLRWQKCPAKEINAYQRQRVYVWSQLQKKHKWVVLNVKQPTIWWTMQETLFYWCSVRAGRTKPTEQSVLVLGTDNARKDRGKPKKQQTQTRQAENQLWGRIFRLRPKNLLCWLSRVVFVARFCVLAFVWFLGIVRQNNWRLCWPCVGLLDTWPSKDQNAQVVGRFFSHKWLVGFCCDVKRLLGNRTTNQRKYG